MNNSWKEYKDRALQIQEDIEDLYADLDQEDLDMDDTDQANLMSSLGDAVNSVEDVVRTVKKLAAAH